jgi:ribulose-phosphate 3-epimerase
VTVHVEAARDPVALMGLIQARGARAGIALNPDTPLERVLDAAAVADMVLVMCVFPGFGGQSFMPEVLAKVRELRRLFPNLDIEIDGGIGPKTMPLAVEAGANILVAGNAVYGSGDLAGSIRSLLSMLPVAA